MTASVIFGRTQQMNLQSTLSSCSATSDEAAVISPHHPITCSSALRLEPDGSLVCDHAATPADDQRTRSCLNHSLTSTSRISKADAVALLDRHDADLDEFSAPGLSNAAAPSSYASVPTAAAPSAPSVGAGRRGRDRRGVQRENDCARHVSVP